MSKISEDLTNTISDVFKSQLGSANPNQLEALQRSTGRLEQVLENMIEHYAAVVCQRLQVATIAGFEKVLESLNAIESENKAMLALKVELQEDNVEIKEALETALNKFTAQLDSHRDARDLHVSKTALMEEIGAAFQLEVNNLKAWLGVHNQPSEAEAPSEE